MTGVSKAPARHLRTDRLPRSFGYLWGGFLLASTGDGFAYGAVPLLAVVVDPQPLAVSAVIAANGLPWLLVALPAGTVADRFERRYVTVVSNTVRVALAALLAVLLAVHRLDLVWLLIIVLANASARATYYSAVQATVPELAPGANLGRANALLGSTEAASEHLVGPILGAYLFELIRPLPFIGEAATLGASGLPLARVRSGSPRSTSARGSVWDGARRLWSDSRLRSLMTLIAVLAGLQGLVSGVLVLVATRDWGVAPSEYGVFLAVGAAGNFPGALIAAKVSRWLGGTIALVLAAFLAGLCYLVMAAAHRWIFAGAAFFIAGFVIGVGVVVSNTLRQLLAPPELMGRIGAAWRGIAWGAAPTGALIAGSLAVVGGLRLPLYLAGGTQCFAVLVLAPALFRHLGRARDPSPTTKEESPPATTSTGRRPPPSPSVSHC